MVFIGCPITQFPGAEIIWKWGRKAFKAKKENLTITKSNCQTYFGSKVKFILCNICKKLYN